MVPNSTHSYKGLAPWSTYRAASLKTLNIGTRPFDCPFVPLMYDPLARMFEMATPIPPADFEISAVRFRVSKIPSMESDFMERRKHDDIWFSFVPAL